MTRLDPSASISIVIPTLNAAPWLPDCLHALQSQKPHPPDEILLVDSGSSDSTLDIAHAEPMVRLICLDSFTHGGARNRGIEAAQGDLVVLMTQDAKPADPHWLFHLTQPLGDPENAAVYSRQIPREGAPPMEKFFLRDRFPEGQRTLRRWNAETPPVYPETFFSNVSAAARRSTWIRFPFDETLIMSEDQKFARDVLMAGLAIVYEPASVVVHSHHYTPWQTFQRHFDTVVAFQQISPQHSLGSTARLGRSTALDELRFMIKHHPRQFPRYGVHQLMKLAGALAGHYADRLPYTWRVRCSLNPRWWPDHA